jgi:glycosyltransferase involved in cell wall biosynthesis
VRSLQTRLSRFRGGAALGFGHAVAKNVYICWTRYQRRPESLQAMLQLEVFFIAPISEIRALKFPSYVLSALSMLRIIFRTNPETLWLQLAPSLLLYPAFLYKFLLRRDMLIIADCHNGILRSKWLKLPFIRKLLGQCDLVLFHNSMVLERANKLGITGQHVQLLHTPPAVPGSRVAQRPQFAAKFGAAFVLMPASFSSDEPIGVVIGVAAQLPHLTFVMTGNLTVANRNHDLRNWPPNVLLPGFLPPAELDWLLTHASAVLALTIHSDIELSAGNEALGFGRPLVVSDSWVSRQLFGEYAVLVDPLSIDSLRKGIESAMQKPASDSHIESLRRQRLAASFRETQVIAMKLTRERVRSCDPL